MRMTDLSEPALNRGSEAIHATNNVKAQKNDPFQPLKIYEELKLEHNPLQKV